MLPTENPPRKRTMFFCAACGFGRPKYSFPAGIVRCGCGCATWGFDPPTGDRLQRMLAMADTEAKQLCDAATMHASTGNVKELCGVVMHMRAWIGRLKNMSQEQQ